MQPKIYLHTEIVIRLLQDFIELDLSAYFHLMAPNDADTNIPFQIPCWHAQHVHTIIKQLAIFKRKNSLEWPGYRKKYTDKQMQCLKTKHCWGNHLNKSLI